MLPAQQSAAPQMAASCRHVRLTSVAQLPPYYSPTLCSTTDLPVTCLHARPGPAGTYILSRAQAGDFSKPQAQEEHRRTTEVGAGWGSWGGQGWRRGCAMPRCTEAGGGLLGLPHDRSTWAADRCGPSMVPHAAMC